MDWLCASEVGLIAFVLALIVPIIWLFARRRWLSRSSGMFDCACRASHGHWMLGCARYLPTGMEWFKTFTLRLAAHRLFEQGEWTAGIVRDPDREEAILLFDNQVIIALTDRAGNVVELAMEPGSMTGFLSWLESAAPGWAHYGNTAE